MWTAFSIPVNMKIVKKMLRKSQENIIQSKQQSNSKNILTHS